ncbi:MAG: hypothetical protein K2H12_12855, partial [Acetatifactor sp.]|nr:hypothetical protein [Acetatifactor sp.]
MSHNVVADSREELERGREQLYGMLADAFTWSRWFFPLLTTDRGLREIDAYMQEYIRYTVTGRHYKGNYRISYGQLQSWGYVSLVHE